jgi:hypothetical protein
MIYALSEDKKKTSGRFSVPADWNIGIAYNAGNFAGGISLTTWVEEYKDEDKEFIARM